MVRSRTKATEFSFLYLVPINVFFFQTLSRKDYGGRERGGLKLAKVVFIVSFLTVLPTIGANLRHIVCWFSSVYVLGLEIHGSLQYCKTLSTKWVQFVHIYNIRKRIC